VGGEIRLVWPTSGGGTLVRASNVKGPYTDAGLTVTTAGNEFVALETIPAGAGAQFYQLRK
jgi:hypothetical protein